MWWLLLTLILIGFAVSQLLHLSLFGWVMFSVFGVAALGAGFKAWKSLKNDVYDRF